MKYAMLVNGRPKYAPRRIIWDGMQVFNPAPEKLLALGYKPVQTAPFPAQDPEPGYYWADEWEDDGEQLVQSWVQLPETEAEEE